MTLSTALFVPAVPEVREVSLAEHVEAAAAIVIKQFTPWRLLEAKGVSWEPALVLDAPALVTPSALQRLVPRCKDMGEVVYGVGGGRAADAAKFVAHALGLPWVCVPSALSCLAFFTAHVELWTLNGWERYEAAPATLVLLDWSLISAAPPLYRAAGIVDVLSLITACASWQRNPHAQPAYDASLADLARAVAMLGAQHARLAHAGEVSALRALAMALALTAQLERWAGHTHMRIGKEHVLAWQAYQLAEGATWRGEPAPPRFTYAQLLAAGILEAALRLDLDAALLREALGASVSRS
ncbi:MAG: iron-containing alcohol dehydrogenase [Thermoflexales bacterium]|nr:iron-containing alcohol dehydrogenase [Thermoflexales bacterium]MDW8053728.1 iron-containing alcohol dehydrogenase [Anaerolineae bacterium]MDW8293017.1 iron-containing alcohol dehydrogenase [Anaerolineae bacterium]